MKRPFIRVESPLFPGRVFKVAGEWAWHEQHYLAHGPGANAETTELHRLMRKHGIDWFKPTKNRRYYSEARRDRVSKGKRAKPHPYRGQKLPSMYKWRGKTEKPHMKEWSITVGITGEREPRMIIVTNLAAWCRTVGVSYAIIKGKLRFNSWPYIPRAGLNIHHIRKWS